MSLFQSSVLKKYLKEASQIEIKSAYEKLITYFHNPVIQQNIRKAFYVNFLLQYLDIQLTRPPILI